MDIKTSTEFKSCLSYSASGELPDIQFVEKVQELSMFAFKFYSLENSEESQLKGQADLEKLIMMNVNQKFYSVKSDFSKALNLIRSYLRGRKSPFGSLIVSKEGVYYIHRLTI